MNIFEDLIDELKEENLIENTVIQTGKAKAKLAELEGKAVKADSEVLIEQDVISADAEHFSDEEFVELTPTVPEPVEAVEVSPAENVEELTENIEEFSDVSIVSESFSGFVEPEPVEVETAGSEVSESEISDDTDFYRKRAMDEVTFLQMVESAFAGVERDQMKIVPSFYDDLEVKKVLHSYLQISPKASASERSQGEVRLLQATEGWYSTLAERDKRIMTAHLRRYCETSRPPLSMPALIALARFYRNSPYSESVRSKFDLMLTRIFSAEDYGSRRELSFSRDELVVYIKELYAEWSSVPMYSTDEDDKGILETVAQFEDFIKEANAVERFDNLVNSNFFNRLRQFKESTNEDFYAPPIAAAGIELNVTIGNRYVELLEQEKQKDGIEAVESKYGLVNDSAVSETMGKTMTLVELLNQRQTPPEPIEEPQYSEESAPPVEIVKPETPEAKAAAKNAKFAKWIFAALIFFVVAGAVYYVIDFSTPEEITSAPPLDMENSMLKNYLKDARIEDDTLRGAVLPAWDAMKSEERKKVLKTMLTFGGEKGYRRIELTNGRNKKIAVADDGGVHVVE